MTSKFFFKKTPIILIMIGLIVPASLFFAPKKTEALFGCVANKTPNVNPSLNEVPVNDSSNLAQNTTSARNTSGINTKECILDGIAWTVAKTFIHQITKSLVNWINSGFNGSPSFIQNPGDFFLQVGDRVAGKFIEGSSLGFLCSPFEFNLKLALAINFGSKFKDEISCTLSDAIKNTEGFVEGVQGKFTDNGGWQNWVHLKSNPNNDAYGAYLNANEEMGFRIKTAKGDFSQELNWGQGFLSMKNCSKYSEKNSETGKKTCEKYETATPGTVVVTQLNNTLGSGQRTLELADEFDEIIGALAGQLVNQVIGGSGLVGVSNSGGSNSYFDKIEEAAKKPKIYLAGAPEVNIGFGEVYEDAGAVAVSYNGKDITSNIAMTYTAGLMNEPQPGTYTVTYTIFDQGLMSSTTRTVKVGSMRPATIKLLGQNPDKLLVSNDRNATYIDPGYRVYDNAGINITSTVNVTKTGTVKPTISGVYSITYTAFDKVGSQISDSVIRTVMVGIQ